LLAVKLIVSTSIFTVLFVAVVVVPGHFPIVVFTVIVLTIAVIVVILLLISTLHLPEGASTLDSPLSPRGHRLLTRIPRLREPIINRVIDTFGTLARILRASEKELNAIEGIGAQRARTIKDGLRRLAESSILDHYA
jgi:hypothetical protein